MKNLLVANLASKKCKFEYLDLLLKTQIHNSIELGWKPNDIIIISNFNYGYMGVTSINVPLNTGCLTGSKMFGMKYLFDNNLVNDIIWAHDLDAWQNTPFDCPEFKDVGIACYSNSKYNGGSIFWNTSAKDIVDKITEEIYINSQNKEEPTLNKILKSKEYYDRVTTINNTFNVGCSGYVKRWERSSKPIRVCHFHPNNHTAWETHVLDRNGLNQKGISDRLEKVIRTYFLNLATELSQNGKISRQQKIDLRHSQNV